MKMEENRRQLVRFCIARAAYCRQKNIGMFSEKSDLLIELVLLKSLKIIGFIFLLKNKNNFYDSFCQFSTKFQDVKNQHSARRKVKGKD